jgi:glycosyltransferase involved in cell wall biosynthesis
MAEGIKTVEVIPNVININSFSISERRSVPFTIGFLGSLNTHNKGLDILLSACSGLSFSFILKIGGAGTHLNYYKDLARENNLEYKVVFMEGITTQQKNSFYSDINLFVLPSRYETFGIVLIEAMASGIPVVATRCGGPNDIVNDKTGILTEVDDSLMMREAIIKIYSNYSKYNAEEIRNYVNNKYSYEPFLKRINSIYQTCLSK